MTRYPVDFDTVRVWQSDARMKSNEELYAWRSDLDWCITDAEVDDECEPLLNENSIINSVAAIAAIDGELQRRERHGISRPMSSLGWPREWLDELKSRVRLESIVEQTVALQRRGNSYSGICPFHADKSPSLVIWPDSQRWRCFGCGLAGDVLTWVQAVNRMEFRDAVHVIAAYANVDIPKAHRSPLQKGVMRVA